VYGRSTIPLFGYSLDGGSDVDNNGYPDLVIGGVSTTQNSQVEVLRCVCNSCSIIFQI